MAGRTLPTRERSNHYVHRLRRVSTAPAPRAATDDLDRALQLRKHNEVRGGMPRGHHDGRERLRLRFHQRRWKRGARRRPVVPARCGSRVAMARERKGSLVLRAKDLCALVTLVMAANCGGNSSTCGIQCPPGTTIDETGCACIQTGPVCDGGG